MKNKESGSSLRLTGREETTTAEIKMKTEALFICWFTLNIIETTTIIRPKIDSINNDSILKKTGCVFGRSHGHIYMEKGALSTKRPVFQPLFKAFMQI